MTLTRAFRAGGAQRGLPALDAAAPLTYLTDISEWEPEIADPVYLTWSKAAAIRALYGADHDDAAWYGGQRRALLHSGGARVVLIYQYLVAGQSGAAQAQAFHQLVGAIRPGEVFVADDEEVSNAVLTDWYNTMIGQYGQGIHPYLWTYTGENYGQEQGLLPVEWIASYGSAEPSTPHKLWQFTDSFQVPGVGTADCSLFRGSIGQLAALAYPAAPPSPPAPPADWTFSAVRYLDVEGTGPHSVRLSWDSPGTPAPSGVDRYQVTIRKDGGDIPSYPREIPKGANPESHQFGSLTPGTRYEALVRAVAAGADGHASPWASVTFTTPAG